MTSNTICTTSVIVVGYNGRRFLDGCLSSLLDQDSETDFEVIFADNASVDGSADYVTERYPAVRVVRFGENLGFAEGNNRAARHARGRYLVFVNQDVVLHRHGVQALVGALSADPGLGACQANILLPWRSGFAPLDRTTQPTSTCVGDLSRWGFVEYREVPSAQAPVPTRFLSGACFAIDHQVVAELGYLFDPAFFMYSEDLDLALRLGVLGYRLAVVPDAVAYHLHDELALPQRRDVLRAYRATRNRLLAYYKTLPPVEFRRRLPRLVLGAPLKVFQIGQGRWRQAVLSVAIVPVVMAAAVAAMIASRRYRAERASWTARRTTGRRTAAGAPFGDSKRVVDSR